MKKFVRNICAASLCAVMLLSGCSGSDGNGGSSAAQDNGTGKPLSQRVTKSTEPGNSGDVKLEAGDTYAVISVKDYGDITVKLYPDEVPYAVYNFTELAKAGTYNGRNFHRVMPEFMIQGGSANGKGTGGDSFDGGNFRCEINTSLRHYYGALCMANAGGNPRDQLYIVNDKLPQGSVAEAYQEYVDATQQQSEVMDMYLGMIDKNDASQKQIYDYYALQKQFYLDYNIGAQAMLDTITDSVVSTYETKGGTPLLDGGYTVFGQTVDGFDVIDAITAVETVDDGNGNITMPATDVIIEKIEIFTK